MGHGLSVRCGGVLPVHDAGAGDWVLAVAGRALCIVARIRVGGAAFAGQEVEMLDVIVQWLWYGFGLVCLITGIIGLAYLANRQPEQQQ